MGVSSAFGGERAQKNREKYAKTGNTPLQIKINHIVYFLSITTGEPPVKNPAETGNNFLTERQKFPRCLSFLAKKYGIAEDQWGNTHIFLFFGTCKMRGFVPK
jgi:hypothetical protein